MMGSGVIGGLAGVGVVTGVRAGGGNEDRGRLDGRGYSQWEVGSR